MDFPAPLIAPPQEPSRTRTCRKVQEWPLLPASAPLCVFPLAPDCGLQSPAVPSGDITFSLAPVTFTFGDTGVYMFLSPHTQPTEPTALPPPSTHAHSRNVEGGHLGPSLGQIGTERSPQGPGEGDLTLPWTPSMCLHSVIRRVALKEVPIKQYGHLACGPACRPQVCLCSALSRAACGPACCAISENRLQASVDPATLMLTRPPYGLGYVAPKA